MEKQRPHFLTLVDAQMGKKCWREMIDCTPLIDFNIKHKIAWFYSGIFLREFWGPRAKGTFKRRFYYQN